MTRKFALLAVAAAATVAASMPAAAQDTGNLIVRVRATHLSSANKDDTGFGLTINNKWLPEVDFTYFFSQNLAAELILTVPQKQTVHSDVLKADAGTFKHLPPTLTLQYHFPMGGARPYIGAGINYTNLSSVDMSPASKALGADVSLKHSSFGFAAQVGIDVPVGGGWLLNADVKKVQIGTTVYANTTDAGKFKVDPLLFSVGFGKRF